MIGPVEIWQLADEPVQVHHPRVLRSDDDANRVVLLSLPAGDMLSDHQVHEHALIFLVEGDMRVRAAGEEHAVTAPGLLHFEPAERHEVQADSDCLLVLCLAPWPGVGHPRRDSAPRA